MAVKPRRLQDEGPLSKRFHLTTFTDELIRDLDLLRAGKISIRDAAVRADLAKQVLRAVQLIVTAQKYLDGQVIPIAPPPPQPKGDQGTDGNTV